MKEKTSRASIEFSINWKSAYGSHSDRLFVEKVDFWRDFFPGNLADSTSKLKEKQTCQERFEPGSLVPAFSEKHIVQFSRTLFNPPKEQIIRTPLPGRFYPKGFAWKALNTFPNDLSPFRLLEVTDTHMIGDTNHPLSRFPLTIEAKLEKSLKPVSQRGGSANAIAEMISENGPGMQIPARASSPSFSTMYPFRRANETDDQFFYQSPRLVHHLDQTARQHVRNIYFRLLKPEMEILDLMGSWQSHLPDSLSNCTITGLGLNKEELQENSQLSQYIVHDLNHAPILPLQDQSFDAVICTVSIEYLIHPYEVMAEISRVLRPGGICIIIISDRWFPGKQIEPWNDLHPFERQGMIFDYFKRSQRFSCINTESIRGYPRPAGDKHFLSTMYSDPVYTVWGINER